MKSLIWKHMQLNLKKKKRFVVKSGYIIKHIQGCGKLQFILEDVDKYTAHVLMVMKTRVRGTCICRNHL